MDNLNSQVPAGKQHSGFSMNQPPNYMSYAFGGSYDENLYSQYAPGDYNINLQVPQVVSQASQPSHSVSASRPQTQPGSDQPVAKNPRPANFPPKTFSDSGGGRAPDTQSAIRPTSSRDWRAGSSFSEQYNENPAPRFQQPVKEVSRAAFEVIGGDSDELAQPSPSIPNQNRSNGTFKSSYYSCPACGEIAIRVSDNANRDASCRNGHRWQLFQGVVPGSQPH
jgi:hypothetical protein